MVLLVMVPLYVVYAVIMGRWQEKTGRIIQVRIGVLTGFLTERIRNLTLIKSFVTEQKEEEKGTAAAGELYKVNVQYGCLQGVLTGFTQLTEAISVVIAVIWGSVLLRSGEVDLESWLAFFLFVPMVNSALRNLAAMWGDFKAVQGRAALIRAMVDAPQEQDGVSENIPAGDVEFQNVCFGYVEDEEILEASIPKGETGKNMIRTTGTIRLTAGHRFWMLLATPQTLPYPQDINLLKRIF